MSRIHVGQKLKVAYRVPHISTLFSTSSRDPVPYKQYGGAFAEENKSPPKVNVLRGDRSHTGGHTAICVAESSPLVPSLRGSNETRI